jgi:GNAT superfamily N-acetyltransferase
VEVRQVRVRDPLVAPLLADLMRDYTTRYGRVLTDIRTYPADAFEPPHGAFVVLVEQERAVAGGAFERHDEQTAEIKRVWTHPEHRRQGLAAKVLGALEDEAAARGYRRLVLSTGTRQPEAVSLYLNHGYTQTSTVDSEPLDSQPLDSELLSFEKTLGA